jgi:hypothetical protein
MGLRLGIEISAKSNPNKPNANMAMVVRNRLKDKRIIVAVEGKNRNIIYILPPMCFSQQNAKIFIEQLDVVISELGEEVLEGKPLPSSEPVPFPNWSRKRSANGRHPLHLANRGMLKSHLFRPKSKEGPSPSFSFWNRERADGTDGDPDESEDQERKGHLSQSQYHFFSIRGNNDAPGETLTMDTILSKGESIDSLEDIGREATENGTNILASPTYGAYDDLD